MAEQENSTLDMDGAADGATENKEKLNYQVDVKVTGDCQRHVTVTIPVADVQRYFKQRYDQLLPVAEIPGFRPGKAPRKLIESKFRKTVTEQVKGSLLLDTLTQIGDEQMFSAIGEPEFEFEAVTLEENQALEFEFDIEVRPDFDLPQWKGIELPRLAHDFTVAEIDAQAGQFLRRNSSLIPVTDAVKLRDVLTLNIDASLDGQPLTTLSEIEVTVQPTLSFRDGNLTGLVDLVVGKSINDIAAAKAQISASASNEAACGKEVDLTLTILDIKRYEDSELNESTFNRFGEEFTDIGEVRDAIKAEFERRMAHEENRQIRASITNTLTEAANWQLPPDLLARQSRRELDRAVMELRRNGMSEEFINAYENNLRQNSDQQTSIALREHFILERIAEAEGIEDSPEDYDQEIALIAASLGDSPRRVRSRLEKAGQLDALRNQIVERHVINLLKSHATFKDQDFPVPQDDVCAIREHLVGKSEVEIPVAKSDFVEPTNAMGKGDHISPRSGR